MPSQGTLSCQSQPPSLNIPAAAYFSNPSIFSEIQRSCSKTGPLAFPATALSSEGTASQPAFAWHP